MSENESGNESGGTEMPEGAQIAAPAEWDVELTDAEFELVVALGDVDAIPALEEQIRELGIQVDSLVAGESKAATHGIGNGIETQQLRALGREVRSVWQEHLARVQEIRSTYRDEAAQPHLEDATKYHEDKLAKIHGLVENLTTTVRRDGRPTVFPAPTPQTAGEAELAMQRFQLQSARGFLQEAMGVFARVLDKDMASQERGRAAQLIRLAYAPLVQRRAEAPERHARHLQGAYRKLAGLMAKFLDVETNGPHHRVASHVVQQARMNLDYLNNSVRNHGRWEDTFEMATSDFFGW